MKDFSIHLQRYLNIVNMIDNMEYCKLTQKKNFSKYLQRSLNIVNIIDSEDRLFKIFSKMFNIVNKIYSEV